MSAISNLAANSVLAIDLQKILNKLFQDLDQGHSCSILIDLALTIDQSPTQVLQILNLSGLVQNLINCENLSLSYYPLTIIETINGVLVYITRYLKYELDIITKIKLLNQNSLDCSAQWQIVDQQLQQMVNLSKFPNQEQYQALVNCASHKMSIITGGPGTGKTTTAALLLWVFNQLYPDSHLKIKICAPTGRAASKIKTSLINSSKQFACLDLSFLNQLLIDDSNCGTIHKLLGYQNNNIYFKHNANNLLEIDILIVDEASMISLPLFSKLLTAINENQIRHLIFLGDKNQLASVEEGYVFASLLQVMTKSNYLASFNINNNRSALSELLISNRNIGEIAQFAAVINQGNSSQALEFLTRSKNIQLKSCQLNIIEHDLFIMQDIYNNYINNIVDLEIAINAVHSHDDDLNNRTIITEKIFKQFNQNMVLCLNNKAKFGVENLNYIIEQKIKFNGANEQTWYTGRPIMILQNDYNLGLYNGDIGICVLINGIYYLLFENGKYFIPELIGNYQLAYAITIHKSQGSEFSQVFIVLGDNNSESQLLTKELLYTAVTRAKSQVTIYSSEEILSLAINNSLNRISGITALCSSN